jgi:hypothetical protein
MFRVTGKKTLGFFRDLGFLNAPDFDEKGETPSTFFSYIFYFQNDEAWTLKATVRRKDNTIVDISDIVAHSTFAKPEPVRISTRDSILWNILEPHLLEEVK